MNIKENSSLIPVENISNKIFVIRGQKVMLDSDLAKLYEIPTKRLNEQVKRNKERFPEDFMFQLSLMEAKNLRSQFATSSWGGGRYLPFAFTEHGVAMLSSVLKSHRAVEMNIFIIRAFIKLREMLATHKDLANKVEELEKRQDRQGENLLIINKVLKSLLNKPTKRKKSIGFKK